MNEINKLNPLLEAMNDIDDAIISDSAPADALADKKRAKYFKPLIIAAAAAVLCGATAVTAAANIKMREEVKFNGEEPNDIGYDIYTDYDGCEIRTYTFNLPEYYLLDEVEGLTPVGKLKACHYEEPEENGMKDWYLVDEEGNIFDSGINNVFVEAETTEITEYGTHGYGSIHFSVANFDYDHYGIHSRTVEDHLNVDIVQHTPFTSDEE